MTITEFLHQSWIKRVQGQIVLPTARVLYLVVAGFSLLGAVLGIAAVAVFEIAAHHHAALKPVPDIPLPAPISIDVAGLRNGFLPPTNIRAIPLSYTRPMTAETAVVYFDADSPHGLAAYPNDFLFLGGPDAASFERGSVNISGILHTALKPTPQLVEQWNGETFRKQFVVRVAAKDASGTVSKPVFVRLTISPGEAPQQSMQASAPPQTLLETLSKEIALFVDPHRTPLYFAAYQQALRTPAMCGTTAYDSNFVTEYKRAFEYMRSRMNPSLVGTFYGQLCGAWRSAVQSQSLIQEQAQNAQSQVISENMQEEVRTAAQTFLAKTERNSALLFVGITLAVFMFLSLFLAFLAMESHSKDMQETLEAFVSGNSKNV